jgi:hypothetical protein
LRGRGSPAVRKGAAVLMGLMLLAACTGATAPRTRGDGEAREPSAPETPRTSGWRDASCHLPLPWLKRIARGYFPGRGPELSFVPANGSPFGGFPLATTHSGPWGFLQEVPLIFYGPGSVRPRGEFQPRREATVADIAPTMARMLGVEPPLTATGRSLNEVLARGDNDLRLVIVVVWDGGGSNVLDHTRGSWPFLASLIDRGAAVRGVTVGSSPSVTPAVHATIGTGAFPDRHGIVNINQRDGDEVVIALGGATPKRLLLPTIADSYDQATNNEALVGAVVKDSLHLPMMGSGAYLPGGDADIGVLFGAEAEGEVGTAIAPWYSEPPYVESFADDMRAATRDIDRRDGRLDGEWMGHPLPGDPFVERGYNKTPAWIDLQTAISKAIISREGFGRDEVADLFFTNYKDPDYLGHAYNFYSDEVATTIKYADRALEDLVLFLDRRVGSGRWALIFTADHGQTPLPTETGTWPIDAEDLSADIARFVGAPRGRLIQHIKQNGAWLDRNVLKARQKSVADVARFLMGYTIEDNADRRSEIPEQYAARMSEPVFDAAFPTAKVQRLTECARR